MTPVRVHMKTFLMEVENLVTVQARQDNQSHKMNLAILQKSEILSHILTLFETPASRRQCALERLHILVENKTGTSVRRFPKILEVHIQLDQIENECLCLKLNK